MRIFQWLAVSLLVLILAAPALAAPNLAGTWNMTVTLIYPDGTTPAPQTTVMTLTRSPDDPSLYSGIFDEAKGEYISLQQDAGANIHFAISSDGLSDILHSNIGFVATLQGRGTASNKNFTGTFGSLWGEIGTIKGTRQQP